ncbi:hypothetical protein LMG32289_01014 [Cupriavidus pampae]|uniref:Uncharacterized protein n=1 Tax=Cupriavidus pampae TaxID=659251 RepID=A0ABN7Y3J4_9BURK|nr:hypothetical protein LMG32289_01014 [Cupriavidus pampae]
MLPIQEKGSKTKNFVTPSHKHLFLLLVPTICRCMCHMMISEGGGGVISE